MKIHDSPPGDDIIAWFDDIADYAAATQTEILHHIIKANHETEYLHRWLGNVHDFDNSTSIESLFTSSVPVASHSDLEPYIQRIADGETSPLLTKEPITMLSLSSGTTDGRPKYVPFTHFSSQSTLQIFMLAAAYRSKTFPIRPGGRILEFIYSSKQLKTKGGLNAGTATTHYFASEEFKTKQRTTQSFTCSPYEVISSGDYQQTTYCHLLLGLLLAEQIEFVTSTFAYSIVQALSAFEELWSELCDDIRCGTLSKRVSLPEMRSIVLKMQVPNSSLASEIESKCKQLQSSDWKGLIPTLWPNAKYIYSIMTGSMIPYLKKLRHYGGGLALVAADYGSTESWIGVNMRPSDPPEKVTFTVIPTFAYFEFIPLSRRFDEEGKGCTLACHDFIEGKPLKISEVEVGKQYEIVLTTFTGLYRCRLGDVVEVSGFYKGTPQLSFVCRRKLILTVNIDKNTEKDLQLAVDKSSTLLSKAELVDFTSHAEVKKQPGYYVIYWEIKGSISQSMLQQCCSEIDASFRDHGYVVSRKTNSIGPLELRIVAQGTFRKIMEYYIANGAAMSQFKTPRCISNEDLLWILDRYTVNSYRSTAFESPLT